MPDILFNWAKAGYALQINKGSLAGTFGRSARHTANLMLEHDLAAFVASDAHGSDRRTAELSRVQDYIAMEFSHRRAERLLETNPRRVLRNQPLAMGEPTPVDQ